MSDDIWNRFKSKPAQSTKSKKSTQIGWKSTTPTVKVKKQKESKPDLFNIWDDQRRMDAEDKKMSQELADTKKKARELQKTLRKNKYGEVKLATTNKLKNIPIKSKDLVKSNKKFTKIIAFGMILLVVGVVASSIFTNDPSETLGESTSQTASEDLPRENPDFSVLYPKGKSANDYDTVRISPDGSEPSYTYLDKFLDSDQIFKVTQQEVPNEFDLSKVATDFQATNIIQIDQEKVYHGYSEKGGIQSLIFVKDGKLILIRSPQKFTDDQWAAYIISLKQIKRILAVRNITHKNYSYNSVCTKKYNNNIKIVLIYKEQLLIKYILFTTI